MLLLQSLAQGKGSSSSSTTTKHLLSFLLNASLPYPPSLFHTSFAFCHRHLSLCPAPPSSRLLPPALSVIQKIQAAAENEQLLPDEASNLGIFKGLRVLPFHVNEVLKRVSNDEVASRVFEWARSLPGYKHDAHNYTVMIGILGRSGDLMSAKQLFEEMLRECSHSDIFALNNLLKSYAAAQRFNEVLALFRRVKSYGCLPDRCTFTIVIDSLGKLGRLSDAKAMYRTMRRAGWQPDQYVFNSLIHNFGMWGQVSTAMKCFQKMKRRGFRPSSVTYSALIDMHGKAGNIDDALSIYKEYQASKIGPDLVVYNSIMHALGRCGRVDEAEWVFCDIQKAGLSPDLYTYCNLISSWGKEGFVLEAEKVFDKMIAKGVCPNVPVCNALIHAYHKAGKLDSMAVVLASMRDKWGLVPTLQTYTYLLSFYTDCDEEQVDTIRELMAKTCHPAHKVVDAILCWKGDEKELQQFAKSSFQKMQFKAHSWTRTFANALVNYLHRHGYMLEAHHVWEAALESKLYSQNFLERDGNCWSIFLLDLEGGTAMVALTKVLFLCKKRLGGSYLEAPARVIIKTGLGRYRSLRILEGIRDMLHYLKSPFQAYFDIGCLMCDGKDFKDWLDLSFVETELSMKERA